MVALWFDELVVDIASDAVKPIEVLYAVGEIVDAVVAIEMHVFGAFDAAELAELWTALGGC